MCPIWACLALRPCTIRQNRRPTRRRRRRLWKMMRIRFTSNNQPERHTRLTPSSLSFCSFSPRFVGFLNCLADTPLGSRRLPVVPEGYDRTVFEVLGTDLFDVLKVGLLGVDLAVLDELTEACLV